MNNYINDERITERHKGEFNSRGWTQIDLGLSKELIKNSIKGLLKMRKDSIANDYKPRRIYYDHLFTNNLAAIEIPFNKSICNENIQTLHPEHHLWHHSLFEKTLVLAAVTPETLDL